jgi:hypothetical protein
VASRILGRVLPFSVRVVGRRSDDPRAGGARPRVVRVGVVDSDVHRCGQRFALGRDDGTALVDELRAVPRDAQA